jgi:hypothetical protein
MADIEAFPLPASDSLTAHTLLVTLLDVTPPVWRRLVVPSALPLSLVHHIVQIAMGWQEAHLHEWEVGDVTYGPADEEDWGDGLANEAAALLGDVAPVDTSLMYRYDFGDGWEHLVVVEAVDPSDLAVPPLRCLGGARACPPEDCGGAIGYEHLLDALADPADPEHEELTEIYGDSIDPEGFDRQQVNATLEMLWRAV